MCTVTRVVCFSRCAQCRGVQRRDFVQLQSLGTRPSRGNIIFDSLREALVKISIGLIMDAEAAAFLEALLVEFGDAEKLRITVVLTKDVSYELFRSIPSEISIQILLKVLY